VHLRGGAGPPDHGVARRAGADEGGLESVGHGQHGHEDAHRARDADHGHDGGAPAGADALDVVGDRYDGHTRRMASMTRSRLAARAGIRPEIMPTTAVSTMPPTTAAPEM